jgi:transcription antitermination factor NusG
MASEQWYILKVRSGFETVVVQKLRKLNLSVIVPDQTSIDPQEPHREYRSTGYVYCRFAIENRSSVTSIPGVVAILVAPQTISEKGMLSLQTTTLF